MSPGTSVAGVFTRNVCCSSEVELCRDNLKGGRARALVVNAGNSNAFTGYRGREAVEAITAQVAAHLGCAESEIFISSTGVIGVPLREASATLASSSGDSERMSTSICPNGEMVLTDVPPEMMPTLNVVLGLLGTWKSDILAMARPSAWIGLGILFYGIIYTLVHDGLVHQRYFRWVPRKGYARRLVQALLAPWARLLARRLPLLA